MANERGKKIDKTHLSVDQAEERGFIHRDYIAHCFRWTHAAKLAYKMHNDLQVMDIGCGREIPFGKLLYTSKLSPKVYAAVDVNKLEVPEVLKVPVESGKMKVVVLGQTDAATLKTEDLGFKPTLVTCFEILEHVEPAHAKAILKNIRELMWVDGVLTVSTPCWDPKVGAAANHVNEMLYGAFGWLLEECGFEIVDHWGTFASQKDYKEMLVKEEWVSQEAWDRLSSFYDSNVLATIFAPILPSMSRNCVWDCVKASKSYVRKFKLPEGPWTSSDLWKELAS